MGAGAYGGGSGGGRCRGGSEVKLGCEDRNSATRTGLDHMSMGERVVGLFGQEKRC